MAVGAGSSWEDQLPVAPKWAGSRYSVSPYVVRQAQPVFLCTASSLHYTDRKSKVAVGKRVSGLAGAILGQHPPPGHPTRKLRPIALPQERTTACQTPPGGLLHHDLKPAPSPRVLAVLFPTGHEA